MSTVSDDAASSVGIGSRAGADRPATVAPAEPVEPAVGVLTDYARSLAKAVPRELALSLVFVILSGLSEGVGLVLLIPLLGLVGAGGAAGIGDGPQAIVEGLFAAVGIRPTLEVVLALFAVAVGGRAIVVREQSVLTVSLQQRFTLQLRETLFAAVARAGWLFFTRSRSSDFTHALTTDLDRVNAGTGQVTIVAAAALTTAVYLVLALVVAPVVTLFVLAAGIVLLGVTRGRTRAVARSGAAISRTGRAVYALLADLLGGMKLIKSHRLEDAARARFGEAVRTQSDSQQATLRGQADAKLWFDLGSLVILVGVVYLAVARLNAGFIQLLFVLLLFARVMPRVAQGQQAYQVLVSMLPSFANVRQLQRRCEAAAEPASVVVAGSGREALREGIRLEGVGFRYRAEAADPLIVGLDLEVPAGRMTAIVGPSGSGKSTVADLLLGLLLPDEGRVVVDGLPLDAGDLASWRAATGYVPQETFLLNDTIRANLLWGMSAATDLDIDRALTAARASEFVGRLPEGLDTFVGDRGVRLSGGERQRLALARALLRQPVLLVLDEATSQLDSENERQILADVSALRGSVTIVLITHRVATVASADLVHLLDAGGVVASGPWDSVRMTAAAVGQGLVGAGEPR